MFLDKIKGLLNNPTVQGVAGAAAFGANPLLGLLLGPGIKSDRERKQLQNDAIRQQLTQQKRTNQAQQQLQGLLSQQSTVQAPTRRAGLLDVEGGAPAEFNLPGKRSQVPTISTDAGKQQLTGLLAQLAPQQVASGLLGRPRSDTSLVRNLQAAGIDPSSAEGRKIIESNLTGGDVGQTLDKLNAELKLVELEKARAERQKEGEDKKASESSAKTRINSGLSDLAELLTINSDLENTLQASGLPGTQFRRNAASVGAAIGDAFGLDTAETKTNVNASQRFDTLANTVLVDTVTSLKDFGKITDAKLRTISATKPSTSNGTQANALTIADLMENLLSAAENSSVDISDRKKFQDLIDQVRKQGISPSSNTGSILDLSNSEIEKALRERGLLGTNNANQ